MSAGSVTTTAPARPRSSTSVAPTAGRRWHRYRDRTFWLFVGPWVGGFLLLTVVPMVFAGWMSFTDYDGISPKTNYVGLANYREAFGDPQMWSSLGQTLLLMGLVVPLTVVIGLALALAVNTDVRGRPFFRAIIFLPSVIPVVAGSLTFRLLFDHDTGAVNEMIRDLGQGPIQWLLGGNSLVVLVSFVLWGVGGSMVLSLAALQGVPTELLEAATVDGAGAWRRLISITVPIISPLLLFQVVTGVIFAFQMFVPALLLSAGGTQAAALPAIPSGLRVYMIYVYQQYFLLGRFGYASALLWLLFIVILAFTALVFGASRRLVYSVVDPRGEK